MITIVQLVFLHTPNAGDALADQIKNLLNGTEFDGQAFSDTQGQSLITQAQSLLDQAHALASAPYWNHRYLRHVCWHECCASNEQFFERDTSNQ